MRQVWWVTEKRKGFGEEERENEIEVISSRKSYCLT